MLRHYRYYALILITNFAPSAHSGITFEEVTTPAGINHTSPSFGVSWGDLNSDGWPDIWVGNHYSTPSLYLNNRDGTFTDIVQTVWGLNGIPDSADTHGAAWADFDNDGDQDLIETAGAAGGSGYVSPNHFTHLFVNDGNVLTDKANEYGVRYNELRGRTPLWVDRNQDGLLDVALTGIIRLDGLGTPAFFDQVQGGFIDTSLTLGFNLNASTEFGTLSDFNNDGIMDMIFQGNPFPQRAYDTTTVPFSDITPSIFSWRTYATDVAISDFNGDLLPDIYMTRGSDSTGFTLTSATTIKTRLKASRDEKGFSFNGTGNINFDLYPPWMQISDIYIGSTGINPNSFNFTLSKNDTATHGILPHVGGVDRGVYIGYDPATDRWQITISSAAKGTGADDNINAIIQADTIISNIVAIGFDPLSPPLVDKYWLNTGTRFIERSNVVGLDNALACNHVVSGDFDNDMDVDIYMVCTDSVSNLPNRLYANQGDGTFIEVSGAGGATGTTIGRGENVATADYDQDGFLDLFVTNGEGPAPFYNGPHQLFRNIGNTSHWIEIDLEGITSNRNAIGARVFVTAGGITQLREQSGGMHRFSQNYQRLHFGLGINTQLDSIRIEWPNGKTQTLGKMAADQIIRIMESNDEFLPGKPVYQVGTESGLFIWKDAFDTPYHVRMIGSGQLTDFSLNLISTEILPEVVPVKLEQGDTWSATTYGFSLNARLTAWEDGVDFQLAPQAKALLSVTQDGVPNPRQIYAGINRSHVKPSGWILPADTFSRRASFKPAAELGLFMGSNSFQNTIEFRMNGDNKNHNYNLSLLSSSNLSAFSTVNINLGDQITNNTNGIEINGQIGQGWDGADISFNEPSEIGFSYTQDTLFPPHLVNNGALGLPNAYWIPRATPYNAPQFDGLTEAGIFLWKDKSSGGQWHLRATAGGGYQRYIGTITSDQPAISVTGIGIETNDTVDTTIVNQISFDLNMIEGWDDGIDFSFPNGATISFELTTPIVNPESYIKIGDKKWPVSSLPVAIGGW